jgi:hypothetical protein
MAGQYATVFLKKDTLSKTVAQNIQQRGRIINKRRVWRF